MSIDLQANLGRNCGGVRCLWWRCRHDSQRGSGAGDQAGPDLSPSQALGSEPANTLRRLAGITSGRHRSQARYWKANPTLYCDERLHPYDHPPDRPFLWTRGLQVGGRSLTWGGITLRLSDQDLSGVAVDDVVIDWPIRSTDLQSHYSFLEQFLGVHGGRDGLTHLPDGETSPALPLTEAEQRFAAAVHQRLGHTVIPSRGFAASPRDPSHAWPRSSSCGSTLARALSTGRVSLLSDHMVDRFTLDGASARATGVIAVDQSSGDRHHLQADLVVLCASTIQSLAVLLRSSAQHHPGGFVDPSRRLGSRLMDHVSTSRFFALPGATDRPQPPLSGAGSFFLPFGRDLQDVPFQGGYGLWGGIGRFDPPPWLMRSPQSSTGFLIGHGEVLPRGTNKVSLSSRRDRWDLPVPHIDCVWSRNEQDMVLHMQTTIAACIDAAGGTALPIPDLFRIPLVEPLLQGAVALSEGAAPPGYYIHEVGGAAMGVDPSTSVVDPSNRLWTVPNVLVVDGACWPTSSWQSPTLTMMAITRRACRQLSARDMERSSR